jgi:hydroxyacylglutathione hydrolase
MSEADVLNRQILECVRQGQLSKDTAFQCLKRLKESGEEESLEDVIEELSYQFPSIADILHRGSKPHQSRHEECAKAHSSSAPEPLFFEMIPNGLMASNCYVIGRNGEGAVIDPGCRFEKVEEIVKRSNLKIKYILLTHAHIDHMLCMDEVNAMTGAEIVLHELDREGLKDITYNGSVFLSESKVFPTVDKFVREGDVLEVGGLRVEVFHTPGHTKGSICFKIGNRLFSGDTFFKGSLGKIGYISGNEAELYRSFQRMMGFDESYIVYPGHGKPTTIREEKRRRA